MHFVCGIRRLDGVAVFANHIAGIQADVHLHDAHAGFGIAGFNCTLNRCCAAPTGQQRGVDIEAAVFGRIQHFLRQNQAIRGHHHHIRARIFEHLQGFGVIAQLFRLRHGQTQFQGSLFDRRCGQLHAAAFGAVGLGQHQRNFKTCGGDGFQGGGGKIGRTGKDNFHVVSLWKWFEWARWANCFS